MLQYATVSYANFGCGHLNQGQTRATAEMLSTAFTDMCIREVQAWFRCPNGVADSGTVAPTVFRSEYRSNFYFLV
jgi:hypothetical protein